jgi:hypothetical protein
MLGSRCRRLLLLLTSVLAVLIPAGLADAACPSLPPPPCKPAAFTGSTRVHASRCTAPRPPSCRAARGPRGLRGVSGSTGAAGVRGATGQIGTPGAAGAVGTPGAAGPQGPTGTTGSTGTAGSAGAQGLQGVQGDTGAAGTPGAPGPQGPTGTTGSAGPPGTAGTDGAAGPTGPTGSAGPAGAPGATGSNGLSQYTYVYNLGAEVVALEADVTFDSSGVHTAGITHASGAAGITLVTAGTYEVTFSISSTEPSQFALFDNGTLVPGTVYGSGAGTQQDTGQAIVTTGAGDVLTVRNHTSTAAIGLATPIGGTQASTNASVTIEKLA